MRVYLPLTVDDLRSGDTVNSVIGFAVTDIWRAICVDFDEDECAEAALDAAGGMAWELGAIARMAVAVEIPEGTVVVKDTGEVQLSKTALWDDVVAIFIDTPDMFDLADKARDDEESLTALMAEPMSWFDVSERALVAQMF